jgi:hypothetical protein
MNLKASIIAKIQIIYKYYFSFNIILKICIFLLILNKNKVLLFQNLIKWDYEYYQNKDNIFQCCLDEKKRLMYTI